LKNILILTLLFFVTSCSNHSIDSYKDERPQVDLHNFFNGEIYALGIVQDRSGQVIKRFTVNINASWKGNVATLDEKFVYSDKQISSRIWELKETKPNVYEGRAADVVGLAKGETKGNVFYFEYLLDLPVGNTSYNITFKDWMYLLDDKTLLARSYMTKWGLKVGEVTIVMSKKALK
jgi:hypothetical protein